MDMIGTQDFDTELGCKEKARFLNVRAARNIIHTRLVQEQQCYLSGEDIQLINMYVKRATAIDKEVKIMRPRIAVL